MAELLSGTVTFLFTDIEGSTRLLKQLRDRYGAVLAEHERILRNAFAEAGGQEIDTQGDAFFVAFSRAGDAVAAVVAAQRGLAVHPWPDGTAVRVRMGIHTGEPAVGTDRYVGLGVHRAARICSAAHGGQVLLSNTTRDLVEDELPSDVGLRDLGEHKLKDMDRPERLFQLVVDGLPHKFPSVRTGQGKPDALVSGRERELAEAARAAVVGLGPAARRRPLMAGVAAIVLLGGIAAIVVFTRGGSNAAAAGIAANSIGFIDGKTNRVREEVEVEKSPTSVAVGENSVWVTNANDATVSQIDPNTSSVRQTVSVGNSPSGIAVGRGSVWVANHADGTVSRINARSSTVVQTIDVGNGSTAVAYGEGSVWVTNADDRTVSRIDPDTGVVIKTIRTDALGRGIAVGAGSVWVTDESTRTVVRLDPSTNDVSDTINVGNGPAGIAYGAAAIWVANSLDMTVSKIDPVTGSVIATIPVGAAPAAIAVGRDAVWVSSEFGERVLELDARSDSGRVASSLDVGNRPKGLAVGEEGVWVAVQASGRGHRGGRLIALGGDYLPVLDPASSEVLGLITNGLLYDGLTSQRRTGGAEGTQLVPDLATNLPVPTNGGRTYTFRLRRGIRYSNGSQVRPEDFRRGLERTVIHGSYFPDDWKVAGAAECSVRRCDLSRGVVTTEDTVTIHLTTPNPQLLSWLTGVSPAAPKTPLSIVRRGTPGTGPYMVESFVPDREITFVRNPKFHVWSGAAHPDGYPDEIVLRGGLSGDKAVDAVAAGRADLLLFGPPPDRVPELRTRYTSQLHLAPQSATTFLFLNTRREPFDDARVRRAVNFAVDRAEVARLHGGPELAQPTCQVIPPTIAGYVRFCPYTLDPDATGAWKAPDLERAQRLVEESGTRGAKVAVWTFPYFAKESHYLVSLLRRLGYRTRVKELPDIDTYFAAVTKTHPQAGLAGFFGLQLSSDIFEALTCRLPENWADFCDRSFDRAVQDLLRKQVDDPAAATSIAARLDRRVVEASPWVPLFTPRFADFVSKRVGNYQAQPRNGVLLDQLWVR